MRDVLVKVIAVAAGVALLGSAAVAGVPDPSQSTAPQNIIGNNTGSPLPEKPGGFGTTAAGDAYRVVVRDVDGTPVAGAQVSLDFSAAAGVVVYRNQRSFVGPPAISAADNSQNCKILTKFADTNGIASFVPSFGGWNNSLVVEVRANGVLLSTARARSTELDGDAASFFDGGDQVIFASNFFSNPGDLRSDFDGDGTTFFDGGDQVKFASDFFTNVAANTICP